MVNAYRNCKNLFSDGGDAYFYSKNIENAAGCFRGKNNSIRYNIHVPANSTTLNTFLKTTAATSLVNASITWSNKDT